MDAVDVYIRSRTLMQTILRFTAVTRPRGTDPAMNSLPISAIIITTLFGSAMATMLMARFLPDHHLSPETKSVVSVSVAVVGTLSALVVGLLISTASSSFTAKGQEIADISANVITLDRLIRRYGPEAQDSRVLLRHYTAAKLHDLFPKNSDQAPDTENISTAMMLEELQDKILTFIPANDRQRWLQAQSLQLTAEVMAARWQLAQGNASTPRLLLSLFTILVRYHFCQLLLICATQHHGDRCDTPLLGWSR
jgi:hypothetical protein